MDLGDMLNNLTVLFPVNGKYKICGGEGGKKKKSLILTRPDCTQSPHSIVSSNK